MKNKKIYESKNSNEINMEKEDMVDIEIDNTNEDSLNISGDKCKIDIDDSLTSNEEVQPNYVIGSMNSNTYLFNQNKKIRNEVFLKDILYSFCASFIPHILCIIMFSESSIVFIMNLILIMAVLYLFLYVQSESYIVLLNIQYHMIYLFWLSTFLFNSVGIAYSLREIKYLATFLQGLLIYVYIRFDNYIILYIFIIVVLLVPVNDPMTIGYSESMQKITLTNILVFIEVFILNLFKAKSDLKIQTIMMVVFTMLRTPLFLFYVSYCVFLAHRLLIVKKQKKIILESIKRLKMRLISLYLDRNLVNVEDNSINFDNNINNNREERGSSFEAGNDVDVNNVNDGNGVNNKLDVEKANPGTEVSMGDHKKVIKSQIQDIKNKLSNFGSSFFDNNFNVPHFSLKSDKMDAIVNNQVSTKPLIDNRETKNFSSQKDVKSTSYQYKPLFVSNRNSMSSFRSTYLDEQIKRTPKDSTPVIEDASIKDNISNDFLSSNFNIRNFYQNN